MRKLFLVAFFTAAFSPAIYAQQATGWQQSEQDIIRLAVAPKQMNGIGRMVVNITDEAGNPIEGAFAKLDSRRTDGFLCESWASTNALGLAPLPPIHMGRLKLKVKAKGYQEQVLEVPLESLAEPVVVKLRKK